MVVCGSLREFTELQHVAYPRSTWESPIGIVVTSLYHLCLDSDCN